MIPVSGDHERKTSTYILIYKKNLVCVVRITKETVYPGRVRPIEV
jgi:hypothetical protein